MSRDKNDDAKTPQPTQTKTDGKIHPASQRQWWRRGLSSVLTGLTTIRFRLMLWYVATTAVLLIVSSGLLYTTLAQTLQQSNETASNEISNLARRIATETTGVNLVFWQELPSVKEALASGSQVLYVNQNGVYTTLSMVDGTIVTQVNTSNRQAPPVVLPPDSQTIPNNTRPVPIPIGAYVCSATDLLTASESVTINTDRLMTDSMKQAVVACQIRQLNSYGQPVGNIIVSQPRDDAQILQRLLLNLALVIPAILFILAIGGYWVASKAMRPVHTIAQTARQIDKTDLSKRIQLKSRDELGELAATFDNMLGRLEKLFEHQRRFTADASHELRTPLTVMNVALDQALEGRTTPENYDQALSLLEKDTRVLLTAREENEHMSRLVNNLLLLARADTGQQLLEKEEVDGSEVVLDVTERLTTLAKSQHIELSLGELPELLLDADRNYLTSMLLNLIENAIKYTAGHGSRVHIESGHGSGEQKGWCWFAIEDDGPGIEPAHVAHIFERFYRITMNRVERPENGQSKSLEAPRGSGLGLSIVHWIAQVHGGRVCLESTTWQGSRFEVWLPLANRKEGSD